MKKTQVIKKTIEEEVIEDVLCNKCGESCKVDDYPTFEGLIEIDLSGGYYSKKLGDMIGYRFSLCEMCLVDLFATFKIPVEMKDYNCTDWIPADKFESECEKVYNSFNTKADDGET